MFRKMYNNSSQPPPMSPRISFSNDFVESHNNSHHIFSSNRSELSPPSTDFEFSVANNNRLSSVTSADELFFKGKLLPSYKHNSKMQRTLRDELLDNDDVGDNGFPLKPPKGSSSNTWKGFLGLRKSHISSKKPQKLDVSTFDSGNRLSFSFDDRNLTKTPQESMSSEEPSSSDIEMGM